MVKLHGPSESYDLAPRANIFRRDQGNANNFSAFKRLMRSNNYKTDPLSHGHACETICCRGDLEVDARRVGRQRRSRAGAMMPRRRVRR